MPRRGRQEVVGAPMRRDVLLELGVTEARIAELRALDTAEAVHRIRSECDRHCEWARRKGQWLLEELHGEHDPATRQHGGRQAVTATA